MARRQVPHWRHLMYFKIYGLSKVIAIISGDRSIRTRDFLLENPEAKLWFLATAWMALEVLTPLAKEQSCSDISVESAEEYADHHGIDLKKG